MRIWLITLVSISLLLSTASAQTPYGPEDAQDAASQSSDAADPLPRTQAWVDTSAALIGEHAVGISTRGAAALTIDALAEEDGGLYKGIFMPWARAEGNLRLAAGGPTPGLGGTFSVKGRVIDPHGKLDMIYMRLFPLDLEFSHERHVRPALSDRREMWARPYTRTTYGWSVTGGNMTPIKGFEMLNMGVKTSHLEQPDFDRPLKQSRFEIDAHFFGYRRQRAEGQPDFEAYAFSIDALGISNAVGADASVGSIEFLTFKAIPLGRHVNLDLGFGTAGTGSMSITTSTNGEVTSETNINTEALPNISARTGHARLYGSYDKVTAEVSAGRSMYLTVDVELAIEDRVAGSLTWLNPRGMLRLEGFAAKTRLWRDETTEQTSMTGGAFAAWQHQLQPDLTLTSSVEVARSFYGSLTGDTRPDSGLAFRAALTLSKHFGTPWQERW